MSDFDPYAYASQQASTQASTPPFDPYGYAAAANPHPDYVPPTMGGNSWLDTLVGIPQAAVSGFNRGILDVAGFPMDLAANVTNLGKAAIGYGESKLTGQVPAWSAPTNPSDVWGTSEWLKKQAAKPLGGSLVNATYDPQSYLLQGINAGAEQAAPVLAGVRPSNVIEGEFTPVEEAAADKYRVSQGYSPSVSAAAAAPDLSAASPELRNAVVAAREEGTPISPQVLERHIQAESLPVPTRLTKGQATQDPVLLSLEQNQRGAGTGMLAKHFNAQNQNLADNMQVMRERIGPDVFSTNQTEHGDTLIQAYQKKDAAVRSAIDQAYDKARQSIPSTTPIMDAKQLVQNVNGLLTDRWATESAPADVMKRLQTIADTKGTLTAGEFEGLRSRLAELARSNDGNTRNAANLIRGAVEDQQLLPQAQNFKEAFDQARALARSRFQALDTDPAYKAAVNETVPPDRFINRFIVNGNRDDIATMRTNLTGNDTAQQTIGTSALEHLRKSAMLDDQFRGNFAAASYNKALQNFAPKINQLFSPQQAEHLQNIGDIARYETAQPKGSFVNNSNTDVSRLATEHGKTLLEGAVNAKTFGIGGTLGRAFLKGKAERALAKEHLAPGAGITWQPSGATP